MKKPNNDIDKNVQPIEDVARFMLRQLFGDNVVLRTEFEFLRVEDKTTNEPEYYFTDHYRYFDFWYNPEHDWITQLAIAIADYYHQFTGFPGNVTHTATGIISHYLENYTRQPA